MIARLRGRPRPVQGPERRPTRRPGHCLRGRPFRIPAGPALGRPRRHHPVLCPYGPRHRAARAGQRFLAQRDPGASSYGNAPHDAVVAIELIRSGRVPVEKMITHRLSLAEAGLGFRLVAEAGEAREGHPLPLRP
ncbi:MAG: hypothetical protein MZU91_15220 [Desulfosudis oleivorans]|nr:hypothetical protein [Desulfosudis oleivorans]